MVPYRIFSLPLKFSVLLLIILSCPFQSLNCLHCFSFFKLSHGWNQYIVFLDWHLSLTSMQFRLFSVFLWLNNSLLCITEYSLILYFKNHVSLKNSIWCLYSFAYFVFCYMHVFVMPYVISFNAYIIVIFVSYA